jgi:hypothetical protein
MNWPRRPIRGRDDAFADIRRAQPVQQQTDSRRSCGTLFSFFHFIYAHPLPRNSGATDTAWKWIRRMYGW